MTYLTQATLDFATVARRRVRDAYDWHQVAWECFPGRDGQARDFLTRLDEKDQGFQLLIVSPVPPTRPSWVPEDCWKGPKEIPAGYFSRRRYRFQLCANPTKKVTVQHADGTFKKNGRREALHNREDLLEWIRRKGDTGGFSVELLSLRTIPRGREYFSKKGMQGIHQAVEFAGLLEVTDPVRFHENFTRGIGSAKAFAFGLLVIAPII